MLPEISLSPSGQKAFRTIGNHSRGFNDVDMLPRSGNAIREGAGNLPGVLEVFEKSDDIHARQGAVYLLEGVCEWMSDCKLTPSNFSAAVPILIEAVMLKEQDPLVREEAVNVLDKLSKQDANIAKIVKNAFRSFLIDWLEINDIHESTSRYISAASTAWKK